MDTFANRLQVAIVMKKSNGYRLWPPKYHSCDNQSARDIKEVFNLNMES
jgi:hypothetical protein